MPAISSRAIEGGVNALQAREWRNTVGQSGMTPTAFSFLIPVLLVAIATPFLCVFCIRYRRREQYVVRATKKPDLQRVKAREELNSVTEISNISGARELSQAGPSDENEGLAESRSVLEKECAICLSTLHAPSLPEPAKLSEAAIPATVEDFTPAEPEAILKLHVCGHEFHAECLVSWFVLRKTSCPICRAEYYSKEAMQLLDQEAQSATAQTAQDTAPAPVVSNWRFFIHGNNVFRNQDATESQSPTPPSQSRWRRFWT
ncbi:uncharacterized protein K460DRAFT_296160 [Cucurbitaria berberidis CBS 394.84]|uniref:RING-type domain-containing protein n=1 Tax=Cucurbitaria berberidis CBS 394.84 TaxID=1168544 RepID=A0A9P4G755_9PLEO|nr:uncharacterized protein K460DRAFT_296160 [Cucurbitaria berberidis CBS 394.84]KAF1840239.1 hypothetical protein K460DRAFT_296160 [Cucurbitaria berberidis CBS 394.84]